MKVLFLSHTARLIVTTLLLNFATLSNGQFQGGGQGFGGQEHCSEFKCPKNDETPLPKSPMNYLVSTGCDSIGGGGMSMFGGNGNSEAGEAIAPCCDIFNACFQICGATKQFCTRNFEKCMESKCNSIADQDVKKKCEGEAQMKKIMMQISQCREFEDGQKNCRCVKKDSIDEERTQVVRSFYAKFNPGNVDKANALADKATDKHKLAGLLYKLVEKYPKAIKKIKDPKQKEMEDLMKGYQRTGSKKDAKNEDIDVGDVEDDNDDQSDERIEL
jgi:hypothetical protein